MALGRGLGAILDEVGQAYSNEIGLEENFREYIREINLKDITPNPYQPRKEFDKESLYELSKSIERHGLLQPIVVIDKGDDAYLLVAGERRLRAHKLAGLESIKAIVADVEIDEAKLRELALIENIQRKNLNAIELAHSYDELIKIYEITHDKLSEIVNKSRSQITNTLRLLSLSTYVHRKLIEGHISQGHAKVLVGFTESEQKIIVDTIIGQKLSVREAELMAKSRKSKSDKEKSSMIKRANFITNHRELISKKLPFSHKLKNNTIEIKFKNEKEVKAFLSMLN
ncbi:Chromosome (plasmid) partitioning protein ParB [hydrothermal vent metagenome]|uniref:Chromosome (Plasmid) partitioning protein ParB n=1 Tax=hydrothermal vent metagenome TaxID=652676 RepID=A0A1W1C047_9ZZZZ